MTDINIEAHLELQRLRERVDQQDHDMLFRHREAGQLRANNMIMHNQNSQLKSQLRWFVDAYERYLTSNGGCDHDVGICVCEELGAIARAKRLLDEVRT